MGTNTNNRAALTDIAIGEIKDTLSREFDITVLSLEPIGESSHNLHFVAHTLGNDLHIVIRQITGITDTLRDLEKIAQLEAVLEAATASLVRTNILSKHGNYLVPLRNGIYVSSRRHSGEVCKKGHNLSLVIRAAIEHGADLNRKRLSGFRRDTKALRYMLPQASSKIIAQRIRNFVCQHTDYQNTKRLLYWADKLNSLMSSYQDVGFVHGDLWHKNFIVDEAGGLQIIDHDCLHFDHYLFDLAHIFLDSSCSGYFSGRLDRYIAQEFFELLKTHLSSYISWPDFRIISHYVLLKKIALVRKPENLFIDERLNILEELESLSIS